MSLDADTARKELRELDRRLRQLVSVAGSRTSHLEPVWKDCEAIGCKIAEIALAAHHATPDDKQSIVDEMTSIHEFYAIATEYLQREQAAVAALLQQIRQSKESLAYYGAQGETGDSCDVAG
jgi:tRNA U34 5-methylaminomethyl-2-thiouridine-forming methyltransferase MnmC